MSITWWNNQPAKLESRNIGTLAVVLPLLERMNVANIINQHLPVDPQAEYDHGAILSLLIAARLYHPLALMNVARWAEESGAEILWGIPPEKLNDDRLGRSLDAFFTQRYSILASLALHVARDFGVPLSEVHYDPVHILFTGDYAPSQSRGKLVEQGEMPTDDELKPAHITKGRPVPDAPKSARMVHAGLCTVVDQWGPLPLFGHTTDGNQNGRTAVHEQWVQLAQHVAPPELTMISDRGTFSAAHLARLKAEDQYALCSAPWGDFQKLYDQRREQLQWQRASYLSQEQQRRRQTGSLPHEHYELAEVAHQLYDAESQKKIDCRVIFVRSTADQKIARQQRERAVEKIRAKLELLAQRVREGQQKTTPQDITRRIEKAHGKKGAIRCFSHQMIPLTAQEQAQLPPRKKGCRLATHRLEFSFDAQAAAAQEQYDGLSVLVTTVPDSQTADTLFSKFKQQIYSEQANHIFKGPLAVHPVFLKSPQRVEALIFLLMIGLMLYYLLQRLYRQTIPPEAPAKERRTTGQTIFRAFAHYALLVQRTAQGRAVQAAQLNERQREILQQLKLPTPNEMLSRRLPRAP